MSTLTPSNIRPQSTRARSSVHHPPAEPQTPEDPERTPPATQPSRTSTPIIEVPTGNPTPSADPPGRRHSGSQPTASGSQPGGGPFSRLGIDWTSDNPLASRRGSPRQEGPSLLPSATTFYSHQPSAAFQWPLLKDELETYQESDHDHNDWKERKCLIKDHIVLLEGKDLKEVKKLRML